MFIHLLSKRFPIELAKRTECFDIEFLHATDNSINIVSQTIINEGLLKENISVESLNQKSRIILSNKIAEICYKIKLQNDVIETFLEINNNNKENNLD